MNFNPGNKPVPIVKQDAELLFELFGGDCKFWVAGGRAISYHFNRADKTQDIDLFFSCVEDYEFAKTKLDEYLLTENFVESDYNFVTHDTKNAITYIFHKDSSRHEDARIQLIKKVFATTKDLFEHFDMGHCEIAYQFYKSIFSKQKPYVTQPEYSRNFVKSWGTKTVMVKKITPNTMARISKAVALGLILDSKTIKMLSEYTAKGGEFVQSNEYDFI